MYRTLAGVGQWRKKLSTFTVNVAHADNANQTCRIPDATPSNGLTVSISNGDCASKSIKRADRISD